MAIALLSVFVGAVAALAAPGPMVWSVPGVIAGTTVAVVVAMRLWRGRRRESEGAQGAPPRPDLHLNT